MQQILGVDIGNSGLRLARLDLSQGRVGEMLRINWCPANSDNIRRCGQPSRRFLPDDPAWLDELDPFLANLATDNLATTTNATPIPPRCLLSSVRRDALQLLQQHLRQRWQHTVQVVTCDMLPLQIEVEFPQQVGIDRLLAALAALQLTPARPLVVIQAGSAVTVDLVSAPKENNAEGCFEGGAIVPGVPMMLRLLGQAADLLPQLDADDLLGLPALPGKNTEQAMRCGTASALVGGVIHLVERYRHEYGGELPIILSGGDGMRLSPYLSPPVIVEDHLVHRGLLRLAQLTERQRH